ncbi:insect allergen related repeat, nitrile-specifier detoxification domain-containing protein [Phthorimaea operculella]|nr:insect allergen related repeat, nitrile-specifier detoxification domain-containing protein [Phthorimaea operculella]
MILVLVLSVLIAFAAAAPQPRKLFHEHFEDFMDLIEREAAHDVEHILEHYLEFEEFRDALDYMASKDFRGIIYEMESLPEFKAVVEFLENDNIDILYFIDRINEMFDQLDMKKARNSPRHQLSGTNFSAFITDVIGELPKEKLAALYEEKIAEDEEFRTAMENLQSEEWNTIYNAFLNSEEFKREAEVLEQNGIDIEAIFDQIVAIFGQN